MAGVTREFRELLASAARTATVSTGDMSADNAHACHVIVNVSALAATPSVIITIEGKNLSTGTYYTVLSGTAITDVTGTGTYVFKVGPGIQPVAGASAQDYLPNIWRVTMTHGDTDSITYSVFVHQMNTGS